MMDAPLFALNAGAIEFLIILIIAFLGMIGSIINKIKSLSNPPPNRVPPRGPRPPQPGQRQQPMVRAEGGTVQEQIEEFLRRAQQRQVAKPQPASPPQRPQPAAQPVELEAVDDGPLGRGVGQQVKTYLDPSEFSRRTSELGGEVVQADQEFNQQVQQAFSGEVSTLSRRHGGAVDEPENDQAETPDDNKPMQAMPLSDAGFGGLFSDPQAIVQAIVLNEILQRRV